MRRPFLSLSHLKFDQGVNYALSESCLPSLNLSEMGGIPFSATVDLHAGTEAWQSLKRRTFIKKYLAFH